MSRATSLDQQIAFARNAVRQRLRIRSRLGAGRQVLVERAERDLALAQAVLATLESISQGARL